MLLSDSQKIFEEAERIVLKISPARNIVEAYFQNLVQKPWRYFTGGADLASLPYWKFCAFFFATVFVLAMTPIPRMAELESAFDDLSAALMILLPVLFILFAPPKHYGVGLRAQSIELLTDRIERICSKLPDSSIDLLEKNFEAMKVVIDKRLRAVKFVLQAIWAFTVYLVTRSSDFPTGLIDFSVTPARPAHGVIFLTLLLGGFGLFSVGLPQIYDKVFLAVTLSLNEYRGRRSLRSAHFRRRK